MSDKRFCILSLVVFLCCYSQTVNSQGTNLLQRYIKEYFQEYFPSTVRKYTLYGNGQNGPADLNAGLPYSYEKSGKVHSLVYSTAGNAPPTPPRASSKLSGGMVENAWVYPGLSNSFVPSGPPNQPGPNPNQQQPQSRSDIVVISEPQGEANNPNVPVRSLVPLTSDVPNSFVIELQGNNAQPQVPIN